MANILPCDFRKLFAHEGLDTLTTDLWTLSMKDAHYSSTTLLMSVLNRGEVFSHSWQQRGEDSARRIVTDLSRLPFELIPVDLSQSLKAGEFKAVHKIPYVDCVAAALSELPRATLVTADRDFEKLGRHFPILWIAPS